jgi:hypothetical protein
VNFEDAPSVLEGIFNGIDWGHQKWLVDNLPCGACPPRLAYMNGASVEMCQDFTFVEPSILESFTSSVHTQPTGNLELQSFDANNNPLEVFGPVPVTHDACALYETGWTQLAKRVEVCFEFGWDLAFDNVTYRTPATP